MSTESGETEAPTSRPRDAGGLGGPFRLLATSSGLSNLADGVFKLSLPLIAIDFTRSPAVVAGLESVRTLPWLLFALPIGALADRFDRRRVMVLANLARAALVLVGALMLVADQGSIWLLYVIAAGTGTAEVFYDTSAQSILPTVVPRRTLGRANGRLAAIELSTQQFIGPPLAGLFLAIGIALAFWSSAMIWVGAIVLLWALRGSFRPTRIDTTTTLRADIAEGMRFLLRQPLLRVMAVMVGVGNLTSSAAGAILVLYAVGDESSLGLTDAQFGVFILATAAGSIAASIATERVLGVLGRARTFTVSVVGMALWVLMPALTTNVWVVAVGMFFGGFAIMLWNIPSVSFRQTITPDHLLGRLNSVYRLLAWGTMPLGALLGGLLAEAFGVRAVFVIMGIASLTLLIPNRAITDARLEAAERDALTTADV
jgi:MFS family permease